MYAVALAPVPPYLKNSKTWEAAEERVARAFFDAGWAVNTLIDTKLAGRVVSEVLADKIVARNRQVLFLEVKSFENDFHLSGLRPIQKARMKKNIQLGWPVTLALSPVGSDYLYLPTVSETLAWCSEEGRVRGLYGRLGAEPATLLDLKRTDAQACLLA